MKKTIYISGILLINIAMLGMICKMQHWPGAGILLTGSLLLFALVFLPLSVFNSYKGEGANKKMLFVSGFITAFIVILGIIFKIQHWPGASILLVVGLPLPFVLFLPVFIYQHSKANGKADSRFLGVLFLLVYFAVYSGLLSLNVSRNIINTFSRFGEELYSVNNIIESIANDNSIAVISQNEKQTQLVSELSQKRKLLCGTINKVIATCIAVSEGREFQSADLKYKIAEINFSESKNADYIMKTFDANKIGEADKIIAEIEKFRLYLKTIAGTDQNTQNRIDLLLNTNGFTEDGLFPEKKSLLIGKYLSSLIANLELIRNNILLAEQEVYVARIL